MAVHPRTTSLRRSRLVQPSYLGRFWQRLKGSEGALLYLLLAAFAIAIPGVILPTMSQVFVDDVLLSNKRDWLKPLLIGMALTAIVRTALTHVQQSLLLKLGTKLSVTSTAKFLRHVLDLPIPFFLARLPGDLQSRVAANDRVAKVLSNKLAMHGLDLLLVIFYGLMMLVYDWSLTLIGFAIALLNLLVLQMMAQRRSDDSQRLRQEAGKLSGLAMGGLQIIETIKAGGTEADFFAKWAGHFAKIQNATQALAKSSLWLGAMPPFLAAVNAAAILTLGGLRVVEGEMSVGMLVAFQTLMASFMAPVESLVGLGSVLQESEADIRRLDDVLAHERGPGTTTTPKVDGAPEKPTGRVEIEGLNFGYARLAEPLVTDLSLTLRPGTRVALVGGSGSGKSTIARLIGGLYEPWSGTIRFDGRPRDEMTRPELAHFLAMVDQNVFLFAGTVRENLTLWDPAVPDQDLVRAAEDAQLHEIIAARPQGYDSQVEEGGRNFSGGQRQRFEIARALVRNPTVLLLDEATSALDPKTEKLIDDNLRRRGCTCLIVAHRLSTIRDADEIVYLDKGRVVERGTHDELMKLGGRYASLMGT